MKKKLILIVIIIIVSCPKISAQWNLINVNSTQDLTCVDYVSSSLIWIGASDQTIKSANSGSSWTVFGPIKDNLNLTINPAWISDIAAINANTAITAGTFLLGNYEYILKTNNGGSNWSYAHSNTSAPLPRVIRSVEFAGSLGLAAGNNGRIFKSTDSGTSWNLVNTGTTAKLNDVKFSSNDTVFVVGFFLLLRSYDGGNTWNSLTLNNECKQLACKNNVVYAVGNSISGLVKSTDYGITHTVINLPFTPAGAIYAINKDTLLISGNDGLYISKNGGSHWEKFQLSNYLTIRMFDFYSSNVGIAVGDDGFALLTNNLYSAPVLPIASFDLSPSNYNSLCQDDTISLTNTTAPIAGYTYQWQIDGNTLSTNYNATYILTTPGTHTVSLIVTNANGSVTANKTITVLGHDINPFTVSVINDTICSGNNVIFTVSNTQAGINYQLRNGFTNIGNPLAGNGGNLSFSTSGGIPATTTFNVKAVKITVCFTDSVIVNKTINVITATLISICIPSNQNCLSGITNVTIGSINNSSNGGLIPYTDYSCIFQTNLVMDSTYSISISTVNQWQYAKIFIDMNNDGQFDIYNEQVYSGSTSNYLVSDTFTIPVTTLFNQPLRMRVISKTNTFSNPCNPGTCAETEDYAVVIVPAQIPPIANFIFTGIYGCTTTVNFNNTSYNAASYTWDFGDGSPMVTQLNPVHIYTMTGSYTVSLTVCNQYGCDSTSQTLSINIPQTPINSTCIPALFGGYVPPLSYFSLDTMSINFNSSVNYSYQDLTCTKQIFVNEASTYNVTLSSFGSSNAHAYSFWIDYNNDGVFNVSELVRTKPYSSDNFQFVVPENVTQNTPLRARVMNYDEGYFGTIIEGCNNGNAIHAGKAFDFTITIGPALPVIADFSAIDSTVCTNKLVYFTNLTLNANSYIWDFGDGSTDTIKNPYYNYSTPGTYSVKLFASNSSYSDSLIKSNFITISQALPVPVITALDSVLSTAAIASAYQWYRNGIIISGATSNTFTANQDGNYTVSVINNNGCATASAIFPYFPPHVNFNFSPTTYCGPKNLTIYNASTNCTNYIFYFGDSTSQTIVNPNLFNITHLYSNPGVYQIKMVGCNATACDSIVKTFTVYPIPPDPVINLVNSTLVTDTGYSTYEWYKGWQLINGANTFNYLPTSSGNYFVKVTNFGGCTATSTAFAYFPVSINIYADTLSYCGVTNASVKFYNNSLNVSSHFWDFGDGTTSTVISPTKIYNAPGVYDVKYKGCSISHCDSIFLPGYITIDSGSFNINIIPAGQVVVCPGDDVLLSGTLIPGSGYQWKRGGNILPADTNYTILASLPGNYSLVVTNPLGCITSSNTTNISIDNNCVWPGDANDNNVADNYDLLPIGLYYGNTGLVRDSVSNIWKGYHANDWGILQNNGSDIKHIDSNGDGIVNAADTLAINLNYNLVHLKVSQLNNNNRLTDPDLYFITSNNSFNAGDTVNVDLMIGTNTQPVSDLYGLGFDMTFDNTLIEVGSATLDFTDSWLSDSGVNGLSMSNIDEPNGIASGTVVRTNQIGKSGYGKIGTFRFKVGSNILMIQSMSFTISNLSAVNSQGNNLNFNPVTHNITINPLGTTIIEIPGKGFLSAYPNPFSNNIILSYYLTADSDVKIELLNSLGQELNIVESGKQLRGTYEFTLSEQIHKLKSGVYLLKMSIDGETMVKKIIKN